VTFAATSDGVRIIADIGGLKPGKHGFHIHEHGDCGSSDLASAGGHFNPTNKVHGGPDSAERHVGDLGNLEANASGFAHYDRVDKVISLNGPDSIIGKSVLLHEDPDDLTSDPSGNAGKRIACGVIVVAE
jgi:Cu-Zn family superoxide dismutase